MDNKAENKMGTERISKLVITTGLPLMLSLLIHSLYNFVDSIFVAYISEEALTALSLAAPVQLLISSLGLGNAVGLNAVISKALGEKDEAKVKKAANAALFIALCSWLIICILCLLFVDWYFEWQSGGNAVIASYGKQYLSVCMFFSFGQMGQWVFDRFVIASGKSTLFIFTLSAASVTNLILDPIFIFGWFGIPRMETFGAALATVIGQCVGMVAGILINKRWNKEIPFTFTIHQDKESIKQIIKVGFPSTLVQILSSAIGVVMNSILLGFTSTAVAVYGVCIKIMNIATVAVHGINNGIIPIVAYNYGARKKSRINEAIKYAIIYSVLFYVPFLLLMMCAPTLVLKLFDASDNMLAIGIPAVRIFATVALIFIPSLVMGAGLQGLSLGKDSMYISMTRQAILPLILVYILSRFGNVNLVWLAFVFNEIISIPLAIVLWKRGFKKSLEWDDSHGLTSSEAVHLG